jgi:dihydroorotate dehydrogenase electron transfer subunit
MTCSYEHPSAVRGELIENIGVAPDHFRMTIKLPASFATPQPGQFVMARDPERGEPLLSRPLSVYGFRREGGAAILDLLCRVAGRGTSLFSRMKSGSALNILGPLGRGFTVPEDVRQVILLAGGVGVAPLAYLLHEELLKACGTHREITAYLGARTWELLTGLDRLENFCGVRIATDDGSRGYHGLVTDLLNRDIGDFKPEETMIYACGPSPMIKSLGSMMAQSPIRCEVSLEERMACGMGACVGCAVAIADEQGKQDYARVCHDGPVFDIRKIVWNALPDGQDKVDGIG